MLVKRKIKCSASLVVATSKNIKPDSAQKEYYSGSLHNEKG